jgi:hypothetical protein
MDVKEHRKAPRVLTPTKNRLKKGMTAAQWSTFKRLGQKAVNRRQRRQARMEEVLKRCLAARLFVEKRLSYDTIKEQQKVYGLCLDDKALFSKAKYHKHINIEKAALWPNAAAFNAHKYISDRLRTLTLAWT